MDELASAAPVPLPMLESPTAAMDPPTRPGPIHLPMLGERHFFKQPLACNLPETVDGPLMPSRFNLEVGNGRAVYNTSTGNYVVLEPDERQALNVALAGDRVEIDAAPRLYETGLLIDSSIDEVEAIRTAFRFASGLRYSPHLTIAPTLDCNFGCDYCFESHTRGAMPEEVQDGLVALVEDLLERAGQGPDLTVTWFGGEPLMAMDVIDALTSRFQDLAASGRVNSYSADLITNGYGLSASVLERLHQADVRQIQVTVDGPPATHNARRYLKASRRPTFDRIIDNIRRAVDRFTVVIRVNVDRTNAATVRELLADLDRRSVLSSVIVDPSRVEAFSADSLSADLMTADEFAAWRSELGVWAEKRGWNIAVTPAAPSLTGVCQVDSINSFVVDPRGHLFKCWAELGTTARPVGDVCERRSWPHERVGSLAERDPFDDEGCVECLLLPMCLGGCPKTREIRRATGTSECPSFRHNITELVEKRFGTQTRVVNQVADTNRTVKRTGFAATPPAVRADDHGMGTRGRRH